MRVPGVYWLAAVRLAWVGCSPSPELRDGDAPRGVGYTQIDFMDGDRSRALETTPWYPTADKLDPTEQIYPSGFLGYATRDAKPLKPQERLPLILLSHGDKGQSENLAWLAERLAENGYLVAGINHWLNTTLNHEPEETVRLWHRPQDLSFVLTELLADPSWGQRIDPNWIGAASHSSGGYTAFALAGAIHDWPRGILFFLRVGSTVGRNVSKRDRCLESGRFECARGASLEKEGL